MVLHEMKMKFNVFSELNTITENYNLRIYIQKKNKEMKQTKKQSTKISTIQLTINILSRIIIKLNGFVKFLISKQKKKWKKGNV